MDAAEWGLWGCNSEVALASGSFRERSFWGRIVAGV
jgi:hypothetical protein